MKEKLYNIIGRKHNVDSCVVKVTYGDKYIIALCKNSFQGLKVIENGLHAFLRGGKNNPDGFYCHFFDYIKTHPGGQINVTYLSVEGDSPYTLLVTAQQALNAGLSDPNMLNNQREVYIGPYDEATGLYGWLTAAAVLNFRNWQKRQKKAARRKTAG
jgi:hypothetical protein